MKEIYSLYCKYFEKLFFMIILYYVFGKKDWCIGIKVFIFYFNKVYLFIIFIMEIVISNKLFFVGIEIVD